MGKEKKRRVKESRHDPASLNGSSNGIKEEDVEESNTCRAESESLVQNVIELLQSPTAKSKLCGLNMLADVFDDKTLEEVAQNKLVRIAGPLLVDPSCPVRSAAAGALRNLTAVGGPEFCDILVEQDIMTPLCSLIQKFGDSWQPKVKDSAESDEDTDTFIHSVNMLWNLCESNATALKYFNQAQLLPLLVRCLDVNSFGIEVAVTVAECLNTVTEDNQEAIAQMQELETQLQQLLNSQSEEVDQLLFRVLISGVLININAGGIGAMDPSRLSLIMASLSTVLACDQRQLLNELTSELEINIRKRNPLRKITREEIDEEMDAEMESDDEEEKSEEAKMPSTRTRGRNSHPSSNRTVDLIRHEQKLISKASRLLQAQQIALEVLANMCSGEDEEDGMEVDDSESEEMSDSSIGEDGGSQEAIPVSVSSDLMELIVSHRLVTKVWSKTILPAENVCELLREHKDCQTINNRLSLLRSRAFLCLQNLLAVMDLEELGGCSDLYNMWLETTKLVFEKIKSTDLQLLEAATSVMRAAVQRLAQAKATQFTSLSSSDLEILFRAETECKDSTVRANLIRIVGCIGQLLIASNSAHIPVIGRFLLESASRGTELWVTAEALDCIFDVFGEDETDKAAYEIDLVNKLRGLAPCLKNKVRMQKKNLGDHLHLVMTANNNLNRFIKYKSKRLANLPSNGHS